MYPLECPCLWEFPLRPRDGFENNVWAALAGLQMVSGGRHSEDVVFSHWYFHSLVLGDNNLAQQLAVLCGREIPGPIRSSGEYMFIHFTSDFSITRAGFNASFHKSNMFYEFVLIHLVSSHFISPSSCSLPFYISNILCSFSLARTQVYYKLEHTGVCSASGWLSWGQVLSPDPKKPWPSC